jgi:LacI family transcriptional regulator
MVTIRDIAREAGVSVGTVSNVLNGRDNVTEVTRARVHEVITRYGYRPSAVARGLSTGNTVTLGLIVSNILNPFASSFASGAIEAAQGAGYGLMVMGASHDSHDLSQQVDILVRQWVDGIVIATEPLPERILRQIPFGDTPLVMMDYPAPFHKNVIGLVNFDWQGASYAAIRHLLKLGHRRIGYIGGISDNPSSKLREAGYLDALQEVGIVADRRLIRSGNYLADSGYDGARALLQTSEPPTAILAANDLMAVGAMKAIREQELHVPDDISLIGMDDVFFASLLSPPLTILVPKNKTTC